MSAHKLTAEQVRGLLDYNPETGLLFWRPRTPEMFADGAYPPSRTCAIWNGKHAGKPAFTALSGHGYLHGQILNTKYLAHRVVWAHYYGSWPEGYLDHINHIRSDNRITNLRAICIQENSKNLSLYQNNASGIAGVSWNESAGKWSASIRHGNKKIHLGLYPDLYGAASARKGAEKALGFHENHGAAK